MTKYKAVCSENDLNGAEFSNKDDALREANQHMVEYETHVTDVITIQKKSWKWNLFRIFKRTKKITQ